MPSSLPVLGVCGWSGSGKTTLLESLIPVLLEKGLKVAVVKHDAHGIDIDRPGKDSDRLFRAGSDVFLRGPQEGLLRIHEALVGILEELSLRYDIILLEGHKNSPVPKIWLLNDDEDSPPSDVTDIVDVLTRDSDRVAAATSILNKWLTKQWLDIPIFGCILIGGKSTRMGKPKHLIREGNKTWLQRTYNLLERVTKQVVIVGTGDILDESGKYVRLPDIPDTSGPISGILAAMRWAPRVSWLITACDLPCLSIDALQWLLESRAPGVWAALPKLPESPGVEPLLAHYDYRARILLENLVTKDHSYPALIAEDTRVISPAPPDDLIPAWQNVNTQREYHLLAPRDT